MPIRVKSRALTSPNLTVTNADTALDGSTYKCLVRNAQGFVVSSAAILHVSLSAQPPVILSQPVSAALLPGGTAVFSVTATGENLAYQWYRDDFLLEGKNAATLTLPGVISYYDSTLYRCLVSNAYGQTFSQAALLRFDARRTQLLDTGATVYNLNCLGCHGVKGRGFAGATPPLASADYLLANRNKSIEIALGGITDSLFVNGQWYTGTSPAFADNLTDVQITGVLTYLRVAWNDSTVTGCNANTLDGNGFATCTKTARSPSEIAADSVSYREVKAVRENLLPL